METQPTVGRLVAMVVSRTFSNEEDGEDAKEEAAGTTDADGAAQIQEEPSLEFRAD